MAPASQTTGDCGTCSWFWWRLVCLVSPSGLHVALLTWPGRARLNAIRPAYLSLPRDSYSLTPADVLNGLLWSTDLTNPHVSGALGGLTLTLAVLWLWQQPGARLRFQRLAGGWPVWPALLVSVAAADLLVFAWAIHPA